MSQKSGSENNYDNESPKSPANEAEDPEVGLREEEDPENEEEKAQGPEEGEDMENAGYGDEDAYGGEEAGENRDERGDIDENEDNIEEIAYDKDSGSGDEDMYEEDNTRKGRMKRSKRDKSSKNRKKKVKRDNGYEEAEEDKYIEEMDEIEKKPKKGKKRSNFEEEVDEREVQKLIQDMENAFEEDLICFKNKRPALNKLMLLPTVESYLKRAAYQKAFIESNNNGLDCIAKWLTKLPNGAPPSLQLKKRLVDIIYQLPVTDEHLKSSEIGKVVYGMKNNPNEDPDLKKTLKDIVDKWTRLITDMANDYVTNTEDIRDRKKIDISLDEYRQRSMSQLRRSIPRMTMKRSGFDFVRKPQAEGGSARSATARQQANEECDRMIKDMKRRMKKELK